MPTLPSISSRPWRLALGQRDRDKPRRAAALDPHQDAVLVVVARGRNRLAHVADIGNALPGDFQNGVAFLETAFGSRALRVDVGDHDAFLAGASNGVGRRKSQTELRHIGSTVGGTLVAIVRVS